MIQQLRMLISVLLLVFFMGSFPHGTALPRRALDEGFWPPDWANADNSIYQRGLNRVERGVETSLGAEGQARIQSAITRVLCGPLCRSNKAREEERE